MVVGQTNCLPDDAFAVFTDHHRVTVKNVTIGQCIADTRTKRSIVGAGQEPVTLPGCLAHSSGRQWFGMRGYMPVLTSIPVIHRA